MKQDLILSLIASSLLICLSFFAGWTLALSSSSASATNLLSPLLQNVDPKLSRPLQRYSIPNLAAEASASVLAPKLVRMLDETDTYTAWLFEFTSNNQRLTGQINIPNQPAPADGYPMIVMFRGYVPLEIYTTGVGTKNAAAVYAANGYVTIALDFLGYGESDPEPENTWEARFVKQVHARDLVRSLQTHPLLEYAAPSQPSAAIKLNPQALGLWGHSNGGQIALTTLEVLGQSLPTTLWAPVTAPFPYSILFFGDELADEGKEQRAWLALFEREYDVFDFSLTQHLDRLHGPLQLHHGKADESALISWSDEFAQKIEIENERRAELLKNDPAATNAANLIQTVELIDLTYHRYPGANHNLQPSWNTVVERDLAFFDSYLK